jgi:hypothetical protein
MGMEGGRIIGAGESQLTEETVFSMLSNQRRRFVLHALENRSAGAQVALGALAERVAAWENGVAVAEVGSKARKSVYTSLQQLHLPKMDDAGILDFDDRAGTVTVTPETEDLTIYLEVVNGNEVPWHGYYLGLGAIGVSLLVALATDAGPFDALPDLAWLAFLVVALVVFATAHTVTARGRRLGEYERPQEVE